MNTIIEESFKSYFSPANIRLAWERYIRGSQPEAKDYKQQWFSYRKALINKTISLMEQKLPPFVTEINQTRK